MTHKIALCSVSDDKGVQSQTGAQIPGHEAPPSQGVGQQSQKDQDAITKNPDQDQQKDQGAETKDFEAQGFHELQQKDQNAKTEDPKQGQQKDQDAKTEDLNQGQQKDQDAKTKDLEAQGFHVLQQKDQGDKIMDQKPTDLNVNLVQESSASEKQKEKQTANESRGQNESSQKAKGARQQDQNPGTEKLAADKENSHGEAGKAMEPKDRVVSAEAQAENSKEDGADNSKTEIKAEDTTETSLPSAKRASKSNGTNEVMQNVKYIMLSAALGVAGIAMTAMVISATMARRRRQYQRCAGIGDDCEMRSNFQLVNHDERLGIRTSSNYFL